jgi:ABC-type polysaccharide/polyol phosphate export permease
LIFDRPLAISPRTGSRRLLAPEETARGGSLGMKAYLGAVWKCRHFWLSLVSVDLRSRYRGSVLGIGWSLLQPIGMTVILCTVFTAVFNEDIHTYAPYVFAGLTLWNFVVLVVTQGCQCFFMGEPYIRQFPAPMAIYPLRVTLSAGFHFLVGLLLVLVMAVWVHWSAGTMQVLALLSLLPALVLVFLAGWSVALLFGLATVRFRDTRHLTDVGLQALFYMTPVLYTEKMLEGRRLGAIIQYNPLVPFLKLLREPIVHGHPASLATYAAAGLIVGVLALLACLSLKADERRLIFYL